MGMKISDNDSFCNRIKILKPYELLLTNVTTSISGGGE
jgi:hypothetical protein